LDASLESARLTKLARARTKRGFSVDGRGRIHPLNPGAKEWFMMGVFDQAKRANIRTYQDLICQACDIAGQPGRILYRTTPEERLSAALSLKRYGLDKRGPIIGLNIGSGARWPTKRWPLHHWEALIQEILKRWANCVVLLFGGPEEKKSLPVLMSKASDPRVITTGSDNTVREFAALLELCDIAVVGDTLALHLALGLNKKVVALFGPTSAGEIEMYGRGIKLTPPNGCKCFYSRSCLQQNFCLEDISPPTVLKATENLVGRAIELKAF
jgi:ADP-heptose:LPS heptosyltransferase